jgi:hypothetical protein
MSKRRDFLAAIALILRKMDEITEEMGKPGAQLESLQERWHRLEMQYQALMDRLSEGPCEAKIEEQRRE